MRKINALTTKTQDELEEHFSNYLVSHLSHSAVTTFARNRLDFMKQYVLKSYGSYGASALAGKAYAKIQETYFSPNSTIKYGFDELAQIGYEYIDSLTDDPKIRDDASKKFTTGLKSFLQEKSVYADIFKEILYVELPLFEFIVFNGKDVPLPFKAVLDKVGINHKGELIIADDKLKGILTPEDYSTMLYQNQACVYNAVLSANLLRENPDPTTGVGGNSWDKLAEKYPKIKEGVKEFYFIETKNTLNRDGSPQMRVKKYNFDEGTLRGFEDIMDKTLDPLLKNLTGQTDEWYNNPSDSCVDQNEMLDLAIRMDLGEVDEYPNLSEKARSRLIKRALAMKAVSTNPIKMETLRKIRNENLSYLTKSTMENLTPSERIAHRLRTFNMNVAVESIVEGFSSNLYLLAVSVGTNIKKIANYNLEIAHALNCTNVRVYPDLVKHNDGMYVAIEADKETHTFINWEEKYFTKGDWKIAIGMDNFKNPIYWDLANHSTPHLTGGGGTGSGKSVFIKSLIRTFQYIDPTCEILVIDPKLEFSNANGISVIQDIDDIEREFDDMVKEMDARYKKGFSKKKIVIVDELNDILARTRTQKQIDSEMQKLESALQKAKDKVVLTTKDEVRELWKSKVKDLEVQIASKKKTQIKYSVRKANTILLQKGRSAGFHFIEFGQRLTSEDLDGNAKANLATRICLTVPTATDSTVILGEAGAEKLRGKGDAYFRSPDYKGIQRIQTFFTE